MVLLAGLQIVLRNLFDSGLLWIDPLLRHLVLLLAFAGALLATGAKRHIQINALGRLLTGTASRIAGAVVAVAAGSISLTLAYAALRFFADEIELGGTVFLGLPSGAVVGILPLSFLALAFRFYYLAYAEAAGEAPQPAEGVAEGDHAGEPTTAGGDPEPAS
jgi:TRAP-type C4-dicarboxylate transport system permease small subunit